MRILITSDTHGDLARFWQVFEKLRQEAPIQMIVHCGDMYDDAMAIRMRCGIPVAAVKGNCDGEFSYNGFSILETEAGDFLITHGHMENVGHDLQRLCYKVEENRCIGAFFGHTHRGIYVETDGLFLMNPGSLSKPRDGSGGTFGIIETSSDSVFGKIYRYDDFIETSINTKGPGNSKSGRPKVTAGHLRDLINYSDRF